MKFLEESLCLLLALKYFVVAEDAPLEINAEQRLVNHLKPILEGRDTRVRPVIDSIDPIKVKFKLELMDLIEVDEDKQTVTIHIWRYLDFEDPLLKWDPLKFGNISITALNAELLWTPDINLYNVIDFEQPWPKDVLVSSDGHVKDVPQDIIEIPCSIDVQAFPFDNQECVLTYGSWVYGSDQLKIEIDKSKFNIDEDAENLQWMFKSFEASVHVHHFQRDFDVVQFRVKMQRRATFLAYVLFVPCVLLTALASLVFMLPPDSSEKIGIGLSIFLSYFVLLMVVMDASPVSGRQVPYIGQYYCVSTILIALSVCGSVLVIHIASKQKSTFPTRLIPITKMFSKVFCLMKKGETLNVPPEEVALTKSANGDVRTKEEEQEEKDERNLQLWFTFARGLDRFFFFLYLVINVTAAALIFRQH